MGAPPYTLGQFLGHTRADADTRETNTEPNVELLAQDFSANIASETLYPLKYSLREYKSEMLGNNPNPEIDLDKNKTITLYDLFGGILIDLSVPNSYLNQMYNALLEGRIKDPSEFKFDPKGLDTETGALSLHVFSDPNLRYSFDKERMTLAIRSEGGRNQVIKIAKTEIDSPVPIPGKALGLFYWEDYRDSYRADAALKIYAYKTQTKTYTKYKFTTPTTDKIEAQTERRNTRQNSTNSTLGFSQVPASA